MVKVSLSGEHLVLHLEGAQGLLALKRTVRIPLRSIRQVSTRPVKWLFWAVRKGTHLPGVVIAGTFWTRRGKAFYYVRDTARCVTLFLKGHEYDRIVFDADDKEQVARRIRGAVSART